MDAEVVVEVAQISVGQCWSDQALLHENVSKIRTWYERVASDVDVVVFPELAITGYIPLKGYDQSKKRALAEVAGRVTNDELPALAALTSDRRASLIVGFMEATAMRYEMFNSVALLENGEIAGTYRKIHLPVEENHYFVPGEGVTVVASRLGSVGLSICYDLLFPEVGRVAALEGATLLCVCSNWLDIANLRQLGRDLPIARALENQYHVVFANGVGGLEVRGRTWSLYGCSQVVSATGEVLAVAGDGEERLRALLKPGLLEQAHEVFPVLRDRRPDVYGPLVAPTAVSAALFRDGPA